MSTTRLLLVAVVLLNCLGYEALATDRPNIVFIISDDQDYEHLGFMGNEFVHTPSLDELANGGVVFTTAHLPMSRCHPTLTSFLSGQWPHQSGIYFNYGKRKLNPENSLPNLLKDAGYATYIQGKYWEGDAREMGFTHGRAKTAKTFVREGQSDLFSFLDDVGSKQPFFLWWAPRLPHTPHNPPQKFIDLYDWSKMPVPEYVKAQGISSDEEQADSDLGNEHDQAKNRSWRTNEKLSYAMEAWLDDGVSKLVEKLEENEQVENTLFVFVIDNGWSNGLVSKGSPYEKGVRTPMFFTLPGKIKAGRRVDGLVSTNDIYPTILDYAGIKAPERAVGTSLRGTIEGKTDTALQNTLFGAIYPAAASEEERPERDVYALYARTEKWKYIYYLQDVTEDRDSRYFRIRRNNADYPTRSTGDEDLYAIEEDPYELNNLARQGEHRKVMDQLKSQSFMWWQETGGKTLLQAGAE